MNKVSTKVDMRWDLNFADWVPDEVKEQIRIMVSLCKYKVLR